MAEKSKKKTKKHLTDFRKNFDLPETETLLEGWLMCVCVVHCDLLTRVGTDFTCAFQRDVLVHGRMYISQNYVCFHATVFGWVTVVSGAGCIVC